MPVMPRQGHMARREQHTSVAKEREADARAKEIELYAQFGQLPPHMQPPRRVVQQQQQQAMMQQQQQGGGAFQRLNRGAAPLTYEERKARRREGLITDEEATEAMEVGTREGRCFRVFFVVMIATLVGALMFAKLHEETSIELPEATQRRLGVGAYAADATARGPAATGPGKGGVIPSDVAEQERLEGYYKLLNVKGRVTKAPATTSDDAAGTTDATEDEKTEKEGEASSASLEASGVKPAGRTLSPEAIRERERRLENWRTRQELKKSFETHQEGLGQLVHCGRECREKNTQVQVAYEALSTQVDVDLYEVLFEDEVTDEAAVAQGKTPPKKKISGMVSPAEIQRAYEKKKKELETLEEKGSEYQKMALTEIKDAYNIVSNAESRKYYQLYGAKPPEIMRHKSARDGGWGQDLYLRTHYHKLIHGVLKHFDSYGIDMTVVMFAFVVVFLAPALARLPQTIQLAQQLLDEGADAEEVQRRVGGSR